MSGRKYSEGQVVWAKVKSMPWWPAKIVHIREHEQALELTVVLYGNKCCAHLSCREVANFAQSYDLHSACTKTLPFAKALEAAQTDRHLLAQKFAGLRYRLITTANDTLTLELDAESALEDQEGTVDPERAYTQLCQLMDGGVEHIRGTKGRARKLLEVIRDNMPSLDWLKEKGLGFAIRAFAELCEQTPALQDLQELTRTLYEKLQERVLAAYFESDETVLPSPPEMPEDTADSKTAERTEDVKAEPDTVKYWAFKKLAPTSASALPASEKAKHVQDEKMEATASAPSEPHEITLANVPLLVETLT